MSLERRKTPYFGSVRFFKHLILATIALLIVVPIAVSVALAVQNAALRDSLEKLREEISQPASNQMSTQPVAQPAGTPQMEVEIPLWQESFPELYAQPAQRGSINEEKVIYLSFDDGPSARTPEILDVLDQYDVKATFFVVGKTDTQSRKWMKEIVERGHTIGIHSFSHDYETIYDSVEAYLADFNDMYQFIYEATGVQPQIFRLPGGSINSFNADSYQSILAEMLRRGFVYYDWNVAAGDAAVTKASSTRIVQNVLGNADSIRRAVVLMHDSVDKYNTVEALPSIIEGYLEKGFTFAALTPEVVPIVYTYPD